MMNSCVGEHQTEVIVVGGDLVANAAVEQAGQQDNGAGRVLEKLGLTVIDLTYLTHLVQGSDHKGKGLAAAALAPAKLGHG